MQKDKITTMFKGMFVGGTMLVPGVSGGSMAMLLGIYDKLISSVSSFMKHKKESFLFLSLFAAGGLLGMMLFAKPLLKLIEAYPMPMMYLFIGAVLGGIPMMYKKAQIKKVTWKTIFYPILGLAMVLFFAFMPSDGLYTQTNNGFITFLLLLVSGFISAVALVLPGISVSYMLLLMGMYDKTMNAISTFYLPFLIPLGIGLVLGIILTTRILEQAMKKYPQATYLIILGFVIGSVLEVFPGFPTGIELVLCMLMTLAGYSMIRMLSWNEEKAPETSLESDIAS